MKEFKGTPGPWRAVDCGTCIQIEHGEIVEHAVFTDAFCYPDFKKHGSVEKLANAQLVAAAPDMLNALWEARTALILLESIDRSSLSKKTLDIIEKAINKAIN